MFDLIDHIIDLYKADWQNIKCQHEQVKQITSTKYHQVKNTIEMITSSHATLDILDLYNDMDDSKQPLWKRFIQYKPTFHRHFMIKSKPPVYDSTIDDDDVSETSSYLQCTTDNLQLQLEDMCEELGMLKDRTSSVYSDYTKLVGENPYEEYTYI